VFYYCFITIHIVNSGTEMVEAKHVSGKNIFWSTLTVKSSGGNIFEFVHCPFEGRANIHHKIQPNWLTGRCCLAGDSKGQCRKSKIFLSLLLPMQVDQYIFFQRHVLPLPFLSLNSRCGSFYDWCLRLHVPTELSNLTTDKLFFLALTLFSVPDFLNDFFGDLYLNFPLKDF